MAGRKNKLTVDYFPHYAKHGKTMAIIEQKYGKDGYVFWFKLLELLAQSEMHYYDISQSEDLMYLASHCQVSEGVADQILNDLARLNAIDQKLFEKRCICSLNFIENISDAYRNRSTDAVKLTSEIAQLYGISYVRNGKKSVRNTQSKVKESKVKEISNAQTVFENLWNLYGYKKGRKAAEKAFDEISESDYSDIETNIPLYIAECEQRQNKRLHFSTYLSGERWKDEIILNGASNQIPTDYKQKRIPRA